MKHIVIDARIIDTSTGRYIERLLTHLQKLDKTNRYSVLLLKRNFAKWQPTNANFKKVEANYLPYRLSEQLGFAWFLYRLRADLVHFTMFNHPIGYFKKQVFTIHDLTLITHRNIRSDNKWYYWIKQPAFRVTVWAAAKKAAAIIAPSKFVAKQLDQRYRVKTKTMTIYEAADRLAAKAASWPTLKGNPFILAVGNAYPYKNLGRLVAAFAQLQSTQPKLKLVLVGKQDFFYQQLAKHVKQANIKGVLFTDWINNHQLVWLYQNALGYVFPSLSEGFGLPGLEAMYYGVPVVAARASCLPEIYAEAAEYFDPHSTTELVDKLQLLLNSAHKRQLLAAAGKRRVKDFSWSTNARQTHQIYMRLLSS